MADNALLADTSSYANPNNKLLSVASNDPSQQIQNANGMMMLQRQGTLQQQSQLELARQKLDAHYALLGRAASDPTEANVLSRIDDGEKAGILDPQTAAAERQKFQSFGGDQNKIKSQLYDYLGQAMSVDQTLQQSGLAPPTLVDTGPQKVPVQFVGGLNPRISQAGGGPIQNQMPPSDAASQVPAPPDPVTGAPRVQSKAAFAASQGLGRATVSPFGAIAYPGRAGGATSAARVPQPTDAQGNSIGPDGRPLTVPTNMPAVAPDAPPQGAGPMAVGLPPGQTTAADANAAASVAAGQKLQAAADQVPNLKTTIANMEDRLKNIDTGPNAAKINTLKAGANVIAGAVGAPDSLRFDPKTIASMEDFRNGSVKLAQQQFQQLGGTGTDGQFASASGDVPNDNLSKLGNQQILALNKGLADAIAVKNSAWQNWQKQNQSGPAATYGAFSNDWNQTFSPRAFQLNYLSPQDRADMLKSMSPQELAQVKSAYNTAVARGWLTVPGSK